jgi:microcystin-dependent protein
MTTVYLGQIEAFGFNFPPKGWMQCNGQLLPINQYQALFALLGVTYGGNGTTNFALPDLRGRVPLGWGSQYPQGLRAGEETHVLLFSEMPSHNHSFMTDSTTVATSNGGAPGPTTVLGNSTGTSSSGTAFVVQMYSNASATGILAPQTIGNSGQNIAHENRMPYLVLNFCIALVGVFPSRN